MGVEEDASRIILEWSDVEGVSVDNMDELGSFMGLFRVHSQNFLNGDIDEASLEKGMTSLVQAFFQLGRAVGRPNHFLFEKTEEGK